MIFGLSFGKKKSTTVQDTDVSRDERVVGTQSTATSGVRSGTSSTNTSGTQSSTGTSSSVNLTDQTQSDRGTQSTRGTTTTLGSDVTSGLSTAVQQLLSGGVNDANIASLSNMIAGTSGFNPEAMVAQTVGAARNRGEQDLQERNAAIQSAVGGTDTTNSMAALLAQRGRNDLESNLAGITAQVTGQAEGIRNANLAAGVGAQGALVDQAAGLGSVLRGAVTTVDNTTLTDQLSQLLGAQTQAGTNTNSTTTNQTQNTATTDLIEELVNALSTQDSTMTGRESSTGTNRSGGGGFSLSI